MAAKTWNGLGGDNNWSTALNWGVVATVPATTDTITFDGTSTKDCTIDAVATWSGGTFTITSAYSGTITQAVNITTAAFSKSGGTWTPSGTPTFTSTTFLLQTGGTFTQGGTFTSTTFTVAAATYVGSSSTMNTEAVVMNNSSGSITATSGNWNLGNDWTKTNSPTFSANGGTITVIDTCTFTAPTTTFNLVVITMAGVDDLTIPNGTTIPLGVSPTSTLSTGTLTITGTVTVSGVWTVVGTIDVSATTGTVSGALTGLAFNRSLTISATATFPSGVQLAWTGSSVAAALTATATTFGTSTLNRTNTTSIATGTTFPLGASPSTSTSSSTFTVNGSITVSGNWGHTGPITVSSTGSVSGSLVSFTITHTATVNSAATFPSGVAIVVAGTGAVNIDVDMSGFSLGTSSINSAVSGNITIKSGTTFPLGANPSVVAASTADIVVEGTVSASGTWTQSNNVSFAVSSGGTVSGTFTLVIEDNLTVNAGATWPSTGSVTFSFPGISSSTFAGGGKTYNSIRRTGVGSGQLTVSGSNTFSAFTDNEGVVAHTVVFTGGTTTTVGIFNVRGSSGKLVTLNSTSATNHILTTTGGADIVCAYMSIANSTVDASPVWYAGATPPSVDGGGGNVNWIFSGPPNAAKLRKSAVLV